jgi:drug/metabolite transporter (DMT)-like permease
MLRYSDEGPSVSTRSSLISTTGRSRAAQRLGPLRLGALYGAAAVLGWACFGMGSAASLAQGLRPEDLTMLRYGVSAVVCLPWFLHASPASGLGWGRTFLLALAAGPLFGALVNIAMRFAPLSHTATMTPAASTLGGMLAGRLFLNEPVGGSRWLGAGVMTAGLAWLASQGGGSSAVPQAWIGDGLFVAAGMLWTAYTFMLRRWNANPVPAVSAVNVISGACYFPIYLMQTHGHFPQVDWFPLGQAAVIQGVVAAFLTVYAYAQSVRLLGAARAAVLPAAVAPVTLTLGALVLGEVATVWQTMAVAVSMVGFLGAIGFSAAFAP